ncbi:MAG: SDR family oxidoreductase, partial [Actinobacteria bacterium]|nr:SDR family oxidoreductase [Actinomycetota bacterium]
EVQHRPVEFALDPGPTHCRARFHVCLAPALAEHGVVHLGLEPARCDGGGQAYMEAGAAMGRPGIEGELDGAMLYLASDASSFVTGHVLQVSGGWTAT